MVSVKVLFLYPVGGAIPWLGSWTVEVEKGSEEQQASIHSSPLPGCGCHVTSRFRLLLP